MTFVSLFSSDIWVPSILCDSHECPYTKFNPKKSSTFQDKNVTFSIQYGAGSVRGDYVQDKVQLDDKISLPNQVFGLATAAKDGILSEATDSNGILGLGFPALTASSDTEQAYSPFVFNLYEQGVISEPVFSISLKDKELQFGLGSSEIKNVRYVDVVKNIDPKTNRENYTFWSIRLNSIQTTDNQTLENKAHKVILDTGTTLSYLTQTIVENMLKLFNISYSLDTSSNLYQVKCDVGSSDKKVQFALDNNVKLDLAVQDLVTSLDGGKSCIFGLTFGFDNSNSFVFGDSVLKAMYLVFDFGKHRVGILNNV